MALFYTIRHSTRSFEEFRSTLETHGVGLVADVRRLPALIVERSVTRRL